MILLNSAKTAIKIIKTKLGKTKLSILDQPFKCCLKIFRHLNSIYLYLSIQKHPTPLFI